jgi:FixJ family two-component response regulator
MFSSQDSFENIVETMAAGAKGFISKPFNREDLISCVQNF